MPSLGEIWRRVLFLFQRNRFNREMEEELRFHLDKRAEQNSSRGMGPREAQLAARRRLGNPVLLVEKSRDAWGWAALDHLGQDVRFALRGIARNKVFSSIVIVTLGCGIGVNTAIFSAVHTLLLNPCPFPESDRIMSVEARHISGKNSGAGWLDFLDWQRQNTAFESMAIFPWAGGYTLTGHGDPQRILGASTTPDLLRVLGTKPELGRFFTAAEDTPGAPPVAAITYEAWQQRFGGDAGVLGRALTLDGKQYSIVGVLPRHFVLPGIPTCEFFTALHESSTSRYQHQYYVMGRLRPEASMAQAQAEMATIARRLEQQYPATNKGWTILVRPMSELLTESLRRPTLILAGAVGFVLLLASITVSGLLLARASGRAKEVAVRVSLGATRLRVLRQMLLESLLLSLAGGVCGVLVGVWLMKVIRGVTPDGLGLDVRLHLDLSVLAFTAAASVASGIIAGLWPAWHISGVDPNSVLKSDGSACSRTRSRNRWMFGLVAGETLLAMLLMTSAGLLSKSLLRTLHLETGVRVEHVLTFGLQLPQTRYPSDAQAAAFYRELLDRLKNTPGVQDAGGVMTLPMTDGFTGGAFQVEGRPKAADWVDTMVQYNTITPGYFRTMGIPILRGRDFDERDSATSLPVSIVNDALARQYFPNQDPIGQRYRDDYDGKVRTIVGVVASVKNRQPMKPPVPGVFAPHAQSPSHWMSITLRSRGDETQVLGAARAAVRDLDSQLALLKPRTMRQVVAESLSAESIVVSFLNGLAGFALLLAAIGIYGIVEHSAKERTREVGIRVALGATYWSVLGLVLRKGLAPVAVGLAIGIPAALAGAGALRVLLYGVSPQDATVYLGVAAVLLAVACGASLLPARRAAKLDAVTALRAE